MGFFVNVHQVGWVDSRVSVGGGKRGVAEKLLDRAQVTACGKKVRRKAVAKRVWGRGGG